MAETLISPGVLARENDSSFITQQPVTVGAAIIGPTVKGPVEVPTVVTTYSDYLNKFGGAFLSGGAEYSFLTQIAAYNYFQQGGESLIVARVVSGAFASATSTDIFNNLESGVIFSGTNLLGSVTSGGTGGTAGTYSNVTTAGSLSGTGVTLNVVTSTSNGKLLTTADALFSSITTNTSDGDDATYPGVTLTGGSGTGAVASVTVSSNAVSSITVTTAGLGYVAADVLTVSSASIGGTTDVLITLNSLDFLVEPTSVTVNTAGSGYVVGETLTVTAANIGTPSADLILTLTASDIINSTAFTLKTISEGTIMNNSGSEGTNGILSSGSVDNVRWQIANADTGSGTFSLLIRQGNDTTTEPIVLETWANLSLDPTQPNFISRVIGDSFQTYNANENYVEVIGNYPNNSRYVYVSAVNSPTPNYFDNNGTAKAQFTSSLPIISRGTFTGATGDLFYGGGAKFYDAITGTTNLQGINATDYDDMIRLMANQDDYRFNVITAPGLNLTDNTTQLTTLANVVQSRGDAIAVLDPVAYNSSIGQATTAASAINNSYAATYWPWLQTIDPGTGQLVWVPAATMIPAVYAFTDSVSEPWFAPAGINRGGLDTVVRAERKLSQTNRNDLYVGNVNPIATFPGTGVVVYGQKTLQKKSSALDRVNVRRLLIALKSYISQVANNLVFEQNTIATRNQFLSQVNPYLESVQQRQGLYAFRVIMDDSNNTPDVIDRNQMIGQIYLQPTKTAEFIYLDFNILPTGATFPA
jgi:hypothetical protein